MMHKINKDKIKSSLVTATGTLWRASKSPDEALGELFADVQKQRIYVDGKTFVDLLPRRRLKQIYQEYSLAKQDPLFDLREFVARNFYEPPIQNSRPAFESDPNMTVSDHITVLWSHLERRNRRDRGSLIALPYTYIVPGGRFNEQFYWDGYFIMLGLAADGRWDMIEGMIKNYAYLMRKFGFIPTANRTYFLSRSQPPFFSQMVRLLAQHKGDSVLIEYLPYLLIEYRFWMKGKSKLAKQEHRAIARVVDMENGELLNRYFDNKTTPRPESLNEDIEAAEHAIEREPGRLYLHLRAGAESGWDFSSRWFADANDIKTIHTADIIPVDLNCLLYQLETTIAKSYKILKQPLLVRKFQKLADRRATSINTHCWDETVNFYMDYNFHQAHTTERFSLAGVFPLYAEIASTDQAAAVAEVIQKHFLKDGGLITTLVESSQQWDAPNGWAPLHWIVIQGLRNYGYYTLANDIKHRWIATN
ncbi:MAG: trehalase family glycosidase, partial [Candidatus Saccharibacteria bacterium]